MSADARRGLDRDDPNAALLRGIVEHLPDIVFRYRLVPDHKYEYVSPSVERILGYTPTDFYEDPDLDIKVAHPEDRSLLLERIALKREGVARLRWLHREGRVIWLDINVVAVRDESGDVIGLEGTARDVTSLADREESERPSDEDGIIRALMNTSGDPIFLSDPDGVVIECNDAFARIFGKSREDVIGTTPQERWPEVAEKRMRQIQRVVRSGKRLRFDEEVGGRYFSVAIHPIADRDGTTRALAVMGHDVTRRKRAEMRMRDSEERYRILYQDNPSMYFTVDEGGTVLAVNMFGAHQLGYEPEDLVGRSVLDVFHPEDRDAVVRQLKACIKKADQTLEWELRKVRKSGEVMWVKETARATRDADGSTIVLIVCEDITKRRRIEEELRKTNERLNGRAEEVLGGANRYGLTPRQLTVLHLVIQGKSDKEIGLALGISPLTVNTHVSRVLRKMGASSRTEAGVRAMRDGLIQ